MREDTNVPKGAGAPTIALALSGGGSRAIAFHLGCLRALHDRGILPKARVMSSVSGGSVIAAAYAYWSCTFDEFDARVVALLRRGFQGRIVRAALFSCETPKILITLILSGGLTLLLSVLRWVISLGRTILGVPTAGLEAWLVRICERLPHLGSLSTAFEHILARDLFGASTMADVRRSGLDVIMNACDLRTGTAFRFGSRASGGWRYGQIAGAPVRVAKAVAASAAYPLLLPPLFEQFDFVRKGQQTSATVVLTDGGVFDNLGVTVLEPGRSADISVHVHDVTHLICLNASAGQLDGTDQPLWWAGRVRRSFATVHRKAQDAAYGRLHRYLETGELKGFVMVYLGQDDARLPVKPPDLVSRDAVRNYPTDFAPMSAENIALLSTRGEQLTHLLIDHYASEL